jgi:hypothetical protein
MLSSQSEILRRLRIPGYFVLALLTGLPLLELAASAWPPNIHLPAWRFTLVAAGATATVNSLLGLFLILVIAVAAGDRGVVWFVSVVCGLAAAVCLIGGGMLPLDALQLRAQVDPKTLSKYNLAWSLAVLKILATAVLFLLLALHSSRAARSLGAANASRRQKGMPLVVPGSAGRAAPAPSENVTN